VKGSGLRKLSLEEKAVLVALLQDKPENRHLIDSLAYLMVVEMKDGGMGSRLLIPQGAEATDRSFGKQIASGEFTDSDGVPVSVTLNADILGNLYELDVWKVDFTPLTSWPDPGAIRILG
jgi:hypothetical protein